MTTLTTGYQVQNSKGVFEDLGALFEPLASIISPKANNLHSSELPIFQEIHQLQEAPISLPKQLMLVFDFVCEIQVYPDFLGIIYQLPQIEIHEDSCCFPNK